jgi:hypothetical protein
LKYRQSLVVESIEKLSRLGVLKYDETNGKLEIAALGKIAVLFCNYQIFLYICRNKPFNMENKYVEITDLLGKTLKEFIL